MVEFITKPQVPNLIQSIFRFNRYERDRWMARKAQLVSSGSRVLDIGAGSAPYRQLFKGSEYRTQDFAQLAKGQLVGGHSYTELDYICDITSIPVPNGSFDAIICTEVLEHVPEPLEAIREIFRILKPGGHAFITAPLASGLHQEPYHFYGGYTPYFYRFAIPRAGGTIESIDSNGSFFRLFSQEALRFVLRSRPWRISSPFWLTILWLPVWSVLCVIAPLVALFSYLYGEDPKQRDFTVGYHVHARKIAA